MATDGIEITDPTLRAATILAISVNGNIHGTIECGRVFRIQALNEAGDNLITANITAHAPDATAGVTDHQSVPPPAALRGRCAFAR